MRAKDGKVTAYKSTHKDSGGGHVYVNIATGREGYHGPDYEKNATR